MQGAAQRGLRVDFVTCAYAADFSPDAANKLRSYLQGVHEHHHKPV